MRTDSIFFALDAQGALVGVQEAQRGRACACTCLACGRPLLAKQGSRKQWHFAHDADSQDRACAESALHVAAKLLLQEVPRLQLPALTRQLQGAEDVRGRWHDCTAVAPAQSIVRTALAELEVARGDVRLDALWRGQLAAQPLPRAELELGVEILVTHRVDAAKQRKLEQLGLLTLEIDLSAEIGRTMDRTELMHLLESRAPRRVVSGQAILLAPAIEQARQQLEQGLAEARRVVESVLSAEPQERQRAEQMLDHLPVAAKERKPLTDFRDWVALCSAAPQRVFAQTHHGVWQAACLTQLLEQGPALIHASHLELAICRRLVLPLPFDELQAQRYEHLENYSDTNRALRSYLSYLESCGLLERRRSAQGHGLHITDWAHRLKVQEFATSSARQKEAVVQRWARAASKPVPTFDLQKEGQLGFVHQVSPGCWQTHLWLCWLNGKPGSEFSVPEVQAWLRQRYCAGKENEAADNAVMSYLLLLGRAGALQTLDTRPHGYGRHRVSRPYRYRVAVA